MLTISEGIARPFAELFSLTVLEVPVKLRPFSSLLIADRGETPVVEDEDIGLREASECPQRAGVGGQRAVLAGIDSMSQLRMQVSTGLLPGCTAMR